MPDTGRLTAARPAGHRPSRKTLSVLDARMPAPAAWPEPPLLTRLAREAVDAAGGHVLRESLVVFDNGGVTLVLVLAESHLSIHTWPEERVVSIDLFSCGAIDGDRVLDALSSWLGLEEARVQRLTRGC